MAAEARKQPCVDWDELAATLPTVDASLQWEIVDPVKTEEQLAKERVDQACQGWPFTGERFKENVLAVSINASSFEFRMRSNLCYRHPSLRI